MPCHDMSWATIVATALVASLIGGLFAVLLAATMMGVNTPARVRYAAPHPEHPAHVATADDPYRPRTSSGARWFDGLGFVTSRFRRPS
jgi:hypothetical protein